MARILVVDDSEDVRRFVRAVLESDGHDVIEAELVQEARDVLLRESPDAVVVDIDLPDGDGISLIPFVGASRPVTRVVVVTGHTSYDQALRALHAGAYDFIPKPVAKDDLSSAVRRAVEARALEAQNEELMKCLAGANAELERTQATLLEYNCSLERRVFERTAELRGANERLAAANRRLEETRDQMVRAEKMASIGCIAAGVAHEINNPIGFINSNLQTLKGYLGDIRPLVDELRTRCAPDDPIQERIAKVDLDYVLGDIHTLVHESEDGVRRVVKIVKDLKTYSRSDNGAPEEADLQSCIESALSLSRNETKYVADIVTDLAPLPRVRCFPVQVTQVLVNLVVNAAHAIEGHGTITVRTRQEGDSVLLQVADTGCGISPENVKRIFDPFFTTKDPGKGTGLGLSLSYEIVERHNGEITVDSAPGQGSTFTVRLPIQGADAVAA